MAPDCPRKAGARSHAHQKIGRARQQRDDAGLEVDSHAFASRIKNQATQSIDALASTAQPSTIKWTKAGR
jgi:hypothetical protein